MEKKNCNLILSITSFLISLGPNININGLHSYMHAVNIGFLFIRVQLNSIDNKSQNNINTEQLGNFKRVH